jgi:methionyl-tRNA formyltransferase
VIPNQAQLNSVNRYFAIAKYNFYLEDAQKAFSSLGLNLSVSNNLESIQEEIIRNAGCCTVFFPHYSKRVNVEDFPNVTLIGFHTGSLPKDRGGSPVQNKILKKEYLTEVSAIKLESELDSGAIYTQREIDLSVGNIEEILRKISILISSMMIEIATSDLVPKPQPDFSEMNNRLQQSDSELPNIADMQEIFDRVRMVDGLDYPRAFIDQGNYRIYFSNAVKEGNRITAKAYFESGE